jgi:hypothetical protein
MFYARLSNQELKRVKRAADAMGFPWRAIAERPRTAREFVKRVEAELAQTRTAESSSKSADSVHAAREAGSARPRFVIALA